MEIILGLVLIVLLGYAAYGAAIGIACFLGALAVVPIAIVMWIFKMTRKIWLWAEHKDLEYQNRGK